MITYKLIKIELYKIFKKKRSFIGFIAIGILIPLIEIIFSFFDSGQIMSQQGNLQQNFIITGNLANAYTLTHYMFYTLLIDIPFLIVLVGGDIMAGEATAGTYRMLVTRPISRLQIVASKFIAASIYTWLLIAWLAIMSLGVGALILGTGPLFVFEKMTVITAGDAFWRLIYAYLFSMLGMTVVTGLAFLFSSIVENAIGPIIGSMAVIIVFTVLSKLPLESFETISPYLFTTYMSGWSDFFENPINFGKIANNALVLSGHIAGLFLISYYIFKKKDILS